MPRGQRPTIPSLQNMLGVVNLPKAGTYLKFQTVTMGPLQEPRRGGVYESWYLFFSHPVVNYLLLFQTNSSSLPEQLERQKGKECMTMHSILKNRKRDEVRQKAEEVPKGRWVGGVKKPAKILGLN